MKTEGMSKLLPYQKEFLKQNKGKRIAFATSRKVGRTQARKLLEEKRCWCSECKHYEWGFEEPHSSEVDCGKVNGMSNLKGFPFMNKLKCWEPRE